MRNKELLQRFHAQIKGVDIKLPLSVYLSVLMLDMDIESKEAYDFAVKTVEDFMHDGMQVAFDLDSSYNLREYSQTTTTEKEEKNESIS